MIDQINREDCCGCEACRQICPVKCICMEEGEGGFLYPKMDDKCIKCGKCLAVCPINKRKG